MSEGWVITDKGSVVAVEVRDANSESAEIFLKALGNNILIPIGELYLKIKVARKVATRRRKLWGKDQDRYFVP